MANHDSFKLELDAGHLSLGTTARMKAMASSSDEGCEFHVNMKDPSVSKDWKKFLNVYLVTHPEFRSSLKAPGI